MDVYSHPAAQLDYLRPEVSHSSSMVYIHCPVTVMSWTNAFFSALLAVTISLQLRSELQSVYSSAYMVYPTGRVAILPSMVRGVVRHTTNKTGLLCLQIGILIGWRIVAPPIYPLASPEPHTVSP